MKTARLSSSSRCNNWCGAIELSTEVPRAGPASGSSRGCSRCDCRWRSRWKPERHGTPMANSQVRMAAPVLRSVQAPGDDEKDVVHGVGDVETRARRGATGCAARSRGARGRALRAARARRRRARSWFRETGKNYQRDRERRFRKAGSRPKTRRRPIGCRRKISLVLDDEQGRVRAGRSAPDLGGEIHPRATIALRWHLAPDETVAHRLLPPRRSQLQAQRRRRHAAHRHHRRRRVEHPRQPADRHRHPPAAAAPAVPRTTTAPSCPSTATTRPRFATASRTRCAPSESASTRRTRWWPDRDNRAGRLRCRPHLRPRRRRQRSRHPRPALPHRARCAAAT